MVYTEDFSMHHYVEFSQIGSHLHVWLCIFKPGARRPHLFLKIDPGRIVGIHAGLCVSAPEAINNLWHDVA